VEKRLRTGSTVNRKMAANQGSFATRGLIRTSRKVAT
jgi:hypothetical protein